MENNNTQKNPAEAMTIADVLRLFKGKLKLFICLILIGGILGGAAGIAFSELSATYGATIKFYLTTTDGSKSLLPLLQSESFAEKLLLDENGLPPKAECNEADYEAALAAVKAHNKARDEKKALTKEQSLLPYEIAIVEEKFNALASEYSRIFNLLDTYKSAASDEIAKDENHAAQVAKYEEMLAIAEQERNEYKKNVYDVKMEEKLELEQKVALAKRNVTDTRRAEEEALEKVLAPWREQESVREKISIIENSVYIEYAKIIDDENVSSKDNQNGAFLIINIEVSKSLEDAEFIVEKLKEHTPGYVEKNLERLTGVNEPQCTLISTFAETEKVGDDGLLSVLIKFGAIGAIILPVFACVVIVVKGVLPEDLFEKKEKKAKKTEKA